MFDPATFNSVQAMEFLSSTRLAVALYPFAVAFINTADGTIQSMYSDASASGSVIKGDGMTLSSSDNILHIAMKSNSDKFQMYAIDITNGATKYYVRSSTSLSYGNSVIVDGTGKNILFGGLLRSAAKPTSFFAGLVHIKISSSSNVNSALYGYEQMSTKYLVLTRMLYNQATNFIYAVLEQNVVDTVSTQVRMRIMAANFQNPNQGPTNVAGYDLPVLSNSGQSLSNVYHCVGLKLLGSSTLLAMIYDVNMGDYYLLTIAITSNYPTTNFQYIKVDFFSTSSLILDAAFVSQTMIYYAGISDSITRSPTFTNVFRFGYIMTLDYTQSCYGSVTLATVSQTFSTASGFTLLAFTESLVTNLSPTTAALSTVTSSLLATRVLPAFGACQPTPSATITPTLINQSFEQSSGNLYYTFPAYTTDITTCSNSAFTYEIEGILPYFITFAGSTRKFTITSSSVVGTYSITVLAILTNTQTLSTTFSINIYPSCSSAVYSAPVIANQDYYLNQPTLSITPSPLFSVTPILCSYTLQMQVRLTSFSGSLISTYPFTWNALTQEIRVYSTTSSDINLYYVSIKATISSSPGNNLQKDFTIRVASECEITQIIPTDLTDYYMNTPSSSLPGYEIIQEISWRKNLATCTESIQYSISRSVVQGLSPYQAVFNFSEPYTTSASIVSLGAQITSVLFPLEQYLITVTAQIGTYTANAVSKTFNLNVQAVADCALMRIAPVPIPTPQTYFIGSGDLDIQFNDWKDSANPSCATMTYDISPTAVTLSGQGITMNFDAISRKITLSATALSLDGNQINIVVTGNAFHNTPLTLLGSKTTQFAVEFVSPCQPPTAIFSEIITSSTVSPIGTFTYYLTQEALQLQFSQYQSTASTTICGVLVYEIFNQDQSTIDTSIFSYTASNRMLSVLKTQDQSKAGSYPLILKIYQSNNPLNANSYSFAVVIDFSCAYNTVSIPSSDIVKNVEIGMPTDISLSGFNQAIQVDSSGQVCENFQFTCSSVIGRDQVCSSIIYTINNAMKKITVSTSDITLLGATHVFKVYGPISSPSSFPDTTGVKVTVNFFSQRCLDQQILSTSIAPFQYDVSLGTSQTITVLEWSKSEPLCPNITYSFYNQQSGTALDSTIFTYTSSNASLSIFTLDPSKVKTYELYVVGRSGGAQMRIDFQVTITNVCPSVKFTVPSIPAIDFKIGSLDPILVDVPPWSLNQLICGEIAYSLKKKDGSSPDQFIQFEDMTLSVFTANPKLEGVYYLNLIGSIHAKSQALQIQVNLLFPCGSAKLIPTQIPDDLFSIGVTNEKTIDFKEWSCSVADCGEISYKLLANGVANMPSYVTFDPLLRTIVISTDDGSLDGSTLIFQIQGTLRINNAQSQTSFRVSMAVVSEQDRAFVNYAQANSSLRKKAMAPTLRAAITEIDLNQRVTVTFSQPMSVPSKLELLEKTNSLQFAVLQQQTGRILNIVQSWRVVSFSEDTLVLRLEFQDLTVVSISKDYDKLRLTFRVSSLYVSEDESEYMPENSILYRQIPPQLSNSTATIMLQLAATTASSTLSGTVSVNMILAMVLGISLKKVWMLMNTLQILTNIPLLSVSIPSNALFMFQSLADLARLNLLPKAYVKKALKEIRLQQATSTANSTNSTEMRGNFQAMGYENANLMENLGLLFAVMLAFIALGLFIVLIKKAIDRFERFKKLYTKLHQKLFFNSYLRSIQKGYLSFAMATMISIQNVSDEDMVQQFVAAGIGLFLLSVPIFTTYFFANYFHQLNDDDFTERFGSLYVNVRTDSKLALKHIVLYFTRRLIYACAIVYFPNNPDVQFMSFVLSSGFLLVFQFYARPMEDSPTQKLEIYNEATIFSCALLLAPFFADSFDTENGTGSERYNFGWMIIAVVLANILVNQVVMVVSVGKKLYQKIRKVIQKINKKLQKCREKKKGKVKKDELVNAPPECFKQESSSSGKSTDVSNNMRKPHTTRDVFTFVQNNPGFTRVQERKQLNHTLLTSHSPVMEEYFQQFTLGSNNETCKKLLIS